eukprot:634486-Prymnesium_polylepis.1
MGRRSHHSKGDYGHRLGGARRTAVRSYMEHLEHRCSASPAIAPPLPVASCRCAGCIAAIAVEESK